MKIVSRIAANLAVGLLFSSIALAESWTGAIIDVMCRPEHIAAGVKKCPNVRQCMLSPLCQSSGYGIVLESGKFLKFDAAGSAKALKLLKATTKETDLKATVTGTLKRDVIQVETLQID